MRSATLLFICWALTGIGWAAEAAPTIDEIAGVHTLRTAGSPVVIVSFH